MSLPPKFAGHKLVFGQPAPTSTSSVPPATHTLEVYLDYVCPFSAKQFNTLYNVVVPLIRSNPKWASSLQIVFRQQIQPWHPSSTLVHEAGLAVLRLAPAGFWQFSDALFKVSRDYYDVSVAKETRNQTYTRLAKLAASSVEGLSEKAVYDLLTVPETPPPADKDGNVSLNEGNAITDDMKVVVKMARLVGVHVSPTVVFDGVVRNEISSSWTKEQWVEWLEKNIS